MKDILSPLEGPLVEVVTGERNVTDLFRDDRSLWEKTRGQTDRPGAATASKLRGLRGLTSDDINLRIQQSWVGGDRAQRTMGSVILHSLLWCVVCLIG